MKILVTHTLERTIEVEVSDTDSPDPISAALEIALRIQPADWDYTWEPIEQEARIC